MRTVCINENIHTLHTAREFFFLFCLLHDTQNHYTKASSGKLLLKRFGASSKTGNNQRNPSAMLHEVGRCQQRENTRMVSVRCRGPIITDITTAQVEYLCSIIP